MHFTFMLLADASTGNDLSGWLMPVMIVGLLVVMYFFMIRPQKKREKEEAAMRDALAIGDEVTTIGGIIGKVVSIKDETFVLETTKDKTKIRFLKNAIHKVDVRAADLAAAVIEAKKEKDAPATDAAADKAPEENTAEQA